MVEILTDTMKMSGRIGFAMVVQCGDDVLSYEQLLSHHQESAYKICGAILKRL